MFALNPQFIHVIGKFIQDSYHGAMQDADKKQLPGYVIDPNKEPRKTTLIYKDKVILVDGKKVDLKDVKLGISLNDQSGNKQLNK